MPVQNLLEVRNLKKHFPLRTGIFNRVSGYVKAVDDVTFAICEGETFGLVGESGCGKTTTARCILRGMEATAGEILFRADDRGLINLLELDAREMRELRRDIQMIFQDPYSSLNPRMTLKQVIGEPLIINEMARGKELEDRVAELLTMVDLRPEYMHRYPHAFSGGQRQRIGIARALITNPRFVACDEAVSALDVSVQAQILNLLRRLQRELRLTYLFIAHDLGVVKHISETIGVMYLGRLVEVAPNDAIFSRPGHPYTEALLSAVPKIDPRIQTEASRGEVPDPSSPPSGCHFHPRCSYRRERCEREFPPLAGLDGRGENHRAACFYADELELKGIDVDPSPDPDRGRPG